jgi:hypothetical protein
MDLNEVKFPSLKEEAHVSLGELLRSYTDPQTQYSSKIHMPDHHASSDRYPRRVVSPELGCKSYYCPMALASLFTYLGDDKALGET